MSTLIPEKVEAILFNGKLYLNEEELLKDQQDFALKAFFQNEDAGSDMFVITADDLFRILNFMPVETVKRMALSFSLDDDLEPYREAQAIIDRATVESMNASRM